MKVTRYPQSCLKIEHNHRTLLVDPGTLASAVYSVKDFGHFDAVLFTHSHADHFDVDILPELAATGAQIYGNANVAQSAGATQVEVVTPNEELVVADFKIKVLSMEHCLMANGSAAGIPNTGFLINNHLLLPGDSTEDIGVTVEVLAVPIFGPDISLKDAYGLALATKAKTLIPIHYDVAGMNPKIFEMLAGRGLSAKVVALEPAESAEV